MPDASTIEVLQEAYKSCCTGISALNTVISKSNSSDFAISLKKRRCEYKKLIHDISCELSKMHILPHKMSTLERINIWSGLHIDTFAHPSDTRLAMLIINGSTAGITELHNILSLEHDISPAAEKLCGRLIECERSNIDIMKNYL